MSSNRSFVSQVIDDTRKPDNILHTITTPTKAVNMFRVTRVLRADVAAQAKSALSKAASKPRDQVLQKGAKRDPELYVW